MIPLNGMPRKRDDTEVPFPSKPGDEIEGLSLPAAVVLRILVRLWRTGDKLPQVRVLTGLGYEVFRRYRVEVPRHSLRLALLELVEHRMVEVDPVRWGAIPETVQNVYVHRGPTLLGRRTCGVDVNAEEEKKE